MKILADNLGSQNPTGPVLVGRASSLASSGTGIPRLRGGGLCP
jgi:hypothetical protein